MSLPLGRFTFSYCIFDFLSHIKLYDTIKQGTIMAVKIKNTLSSDVLMNSIRSIGYNFRTVLADIIDNSISAKAKNIYISSSINDEIFP